MSAQRFDFEEQWPELFETLTQEQRAGVVRVLAGGWHEGWQPNREDVADLADYARGAITFDEYQARSLAKSDRIADAAEEAYYAALSEAAERGELRVKPGTANRAQAVDDDLVFKLASVADISAIKHLVRAAYTPYIERIGKEPAPMNADYRAAVDAGQVLLAWHRGSLAGLLVTIPHDAYLLVENVAVDPAVQGLGVGAKLLERAEHEARKLGLTELRLYTNAKMTENLSYYPRRGYRETGRRSEDGFDRVFFSRMLEL